MAYEAPKFSAVSLDVKGVAHEVEKDGPSKCSNSCCYYQDGATW